LGIEALRPVGEECKSTLELMQLLGGSSLVRRLAALRPSAAYTIPENDMMADLRGGFAVGVAGAAAADLEAIMRGLAPKLGFEVPPDGWDEAQLRLHGVLRAASQAQASAAAGGSWGADGSFGATTAGPLGVPPSAKPPKGSSMAADQAKPATTVGAVGAAVLRPIAHARSISGRHGRRSRWSMTQSEKRRASWASSPAWAPRRRRRRGPPSLPTVRALVS